MSKKCPYCTFKKNSFNGDLVGKDYEESTFERARISKDFGQDHFTLWTWYGSDTTDLSIDFCPWCGRRLSNENP